MLIVLQNNNTKNGKSLKKLELLELHTIKYYLFVNCIPIFLIYLTGNLLVLLVVEL
jgi:NADH:ubiquinone oxidoreductase subunit 4 (subunit M)